MDKIVRKIKSVRYNMWEDFKNFLRIPGYNYYKMPKELKFRYPAPGSVPRTQDDRPNIYKVDWKTSYRDSPLNIRPKALIDEDRYGGNVTTLHHTTKTTLDPNNPGHAEILKGPIRNRDRVEDVATYT